jgi:hypothetical protein
MNAEDRLNRALAARVTPAKDMHFTLEVMRRAEAARFRTEAARRMVTGAALAALAALGALGAAGWTAQNVDAAWEMALAAGGMAAAWSVVRGLRVRVTVAGR